MQVQRGFQNLRIAAFFDCDNFSSKYVEFIIDKLEYYGEILSIQAFRDWSVGSDWNNEICIKYPIEPIHTIRYSGKNSSDLRLQRAVLECLHKGVANCIAIASSDSDFRDLILHIRSLGLVSIGIGRTQAAPSLQNLHHIFIPLPNEHITKSTNTEAVQSQTNVSQTSTTDSHISNTNQAQSNKEDKIEILKQAMQIAKNIFPEFVQNEWVTMSALGKALKSMNPHYNKKYFQTSSYAKLFQKEPYNKHFDTTTTKSTLKVKLREGIEE